MEEAKAAAYYEELTRRGEGAARFKQGLGFSSTSSENKSNSEDAPARGAYASSSPFMSKFVKATKTTSEIESIQNKLKRKRPDPAREENEEAKPNSKSKSPPLPRVSERDRRMRRSRSGSGSRERRSRRRRSRSRERDSDRRRRRSGSESDDGDRRRRRRSPSPQYRRKDRRRSRSRSRSLSRARERSRGKVDKERSGGGGGSAGYSKLIQGYDKMSAAERVKAKMKLQLAETAEKDTTKGTEGWERFEFNKDAPLDDEEVEAADDDAAVVNHIGKSFRFSSFETKREDRIKAAHDEAMFGASDNVPTIVIENEIEAENDNKDNKEEEPPSLLSEKVLAKKQGSWRDRIRQNKN